MTFIAKIPAYLAKNKKNIVLLCAIIASVFIMYYAFNLISSKTMQAHSVDYSLSNNHSMNIIPGSKEGFQSVVSSTVAGTTTTSADTTTTAAPTPVRTLSTVELALCPTQPASNISAVRSLYSGATFKIETITPAKPNEVFICGPGNFVVELVGGASNALKLAVKNTSGNNLLQKFVKEELVNPTDANSKCIVFNAYDTALYIQYEHEHLSLRPLNIGNKPFVGQCFVSYVATPDEINAHALAIGISKVGLDGSELIDSGVTGDVNVPAAPGSGLTSSLTLQQETDAKYADALGGIMEKINLLSSQLQGDTVSSSVFGNKDAIKINVDLSGTGDKAGFANISGRSNFQDMAATGSGTATVSQLLDQYTGASALELGNIPGLAGTMSNNGNGLSEIKQALQNKFKGCPAIDRNQYYTERQLAQCSGCNPDAFLRGQLGGMPK
jgi:hypothetical protein